MPSVTGDRFSSQSMSDCEFCPADGRRFRTARQCAECGKPLCLVCRPVVSGVSFLCPTCGGGPRENSLLEPSLVIERISAAGHTTPFWLTIAHEQITLAVGTQAEELIVPE